MVSVSSVDKARESTTLPSLHGANQGSEAIHVGMVNVDEASRMDKTKGVKNNAKMLSKLEVLEQPVTLGTCGLGVTDDSSSIAIGTLEGFQAVGL